MREKALPPQQRSARPKQQDVQESAEQVPAKTEDEMDEGSWLDNLPNVDEADEPDDGDWDDDYDDYNDEENAR